MTNGLPRNGLMIRMITEHLRPSKQQKPTWMLSGKAKGKAEKAEKARVRERATKAKARARESIMTVDQPEDLPRKRIGNVTTAGNTDIWERIVPSLIAD